MFIRLMIYTPYCKMSSGFSLYVEENIKVKECYANRATQDGQIMVEWSDRMWSTGEGKGKPFQYSCLENPMNSMKRQNDRILKEELSRSVGAQYGTGDQWRNNS